MNRIEQAILQSLAEQGVSNIDRQHLDGLIIDSLVNMIDRLGSMVVGLEAEVAKLRAPEQPATGLDTPPHEAGHPLPPEPECLIGAAELADIINREGDLL